MGMPKHARKTWICYAGGARGGMCRMSELEVKLVY
jgi:hypothetical protein